VDKLSSQEPKPDASARSCGCEERRSRRIAAVEARPAASRRASTTERASASVCVSATDNALTLTPSRTLSVRDACKETSLGRITEVMSDE